jgi:hypothetical protein
MSAFRHIAGVAIIGTLCCEGVGTHADGSALANTLGLSINQPLPLTEGVRCVPDVIPFVTLRETPRQLQLSTVSELSLRQIHALRVERPELFRFRLFSRTTGILSNGCAIDFWWARGPGPYRVDEIRILGPIDSLGEDYSYLRGLDYPEPRWIPAFGGYKHVMSSAVSPSGGTYIGLWRRTDGTVGSLVAAYRVDGSRVLTLGSGSWNYDAISTEFSFHGGLPGFTLLDEPEGSDPLYLTEYDMTDPYLFDRPRRGR